MRWLLMPAKAKDLQIAARKLGFRVVRQKGSHARWKHKRGIQKALGIRRGALETSVDLILRSTKSKILAQGVWSRS